MAAPSVVPIRKPTAVVLRSEANQARPKEQQLKLSIDRTAKALERLEARTAKCDAQMKVLAARKKKDLGRIEAIEERTLQFMKARELERLFGNRFTLTQHPNAPSLVIDDLSKIPEKYLKPQPPLPDKVAIKVVLQLASSEQATQKDIAEGARFVGAVHLMQTISLRRSGA